MVTQPKLDLPFTCVIMRAVNVIHNTIMKRFPITLSALLVAFGAMVSTAKAELKIASVNMSNLNVMFYKRVEAETNLKKQENEIKEEINAQAEVVRKLAADIEAIQKQLDPTLSESATKTLREKLAALQNEAAAKQEALKTLIQRREVAFREVVRRELALIASELHATVEAVASEGGYDLVIDSSAVSAQPGARVYPYVKPSLDISDAVLKRLNAGAPADYDAKAELDRVNGAAGQAAPAPEATPAQ